MAHHKWIPIGEFHRIQKGFPHFIQRSFKSVHDSPSLEPCILKIYFVRVFSVYRSHLRAYCCYFLDYRSSVAFFFSSDNQVARVLSGIFNISAAFVIDLPSVISFLAVATISSLSLRGIIIFSSSFFGFWGSIAVSQPSG